MMDFKHLTKKPEKEMTPKSEVGIFGKRISDGVRACESHFTCVQNFSTPPSRLAKIVNPFENHLLDRLHLPVFSPNVFTQYSTPQQKFKWTIDDYSILKPADIDEATLSQHVSTADSHTESLVQQKIDTFFSEKEIVPSPMNVASKSVPLIKDCEGSIGTPKKSSPTKQYCNGTSQTVLTLPPVLPKELEKALKPFFTYTEDQQQSNVDREYIQYTNISNCPLYRELFEFDDNAQMPGDIQSQLPPPALSTGVSPLQLSPCNIPELKDCTLSPIARNSLTRLSKSACRLDFSSKMSVDISLIVPDVDNQKNNEHMSVLAVNECSLSPIKPVEICSTGSNASNWSMDYKHVSLPSESVSDSSEDAMDVSNSNTPHSKIFGNQRKRLSDSFKHNDEVDIDSRKEYATSCSVAQGRRKAYRDELTDGGYHTGTFSNVENDFSGNTNVFASTPSRRKAFASECIIYD
ncbi:protein aurora borealis isoform X2 [Cylas formicarius]|uniref:protein aurora borealis isoform X2 n=1 Tax=Cylas formicarius TaxID=197179 RepID=UPI0029589DD5|nr:protein aurora borealis isoform X2 [Cylas formicarius]